MERETLTTHEELRRAHESLEVRQNRLEDEDRAPRVDERTAQDRLERKIARLHLKADMEEREAAECKQRIQEARMMTLGSLARTGGLSVLTPARGAPESRVSR
jgi:hypothetical protein